MTGPANAAESAPWAIHPRGVTFTGLSLSTARVTFGAEQGEEVTLTPLLGSLTFSAGSCGLGSSPLSLGSYDVGATYPGNTAQGNFASASQLQHLGVLQVTTTDLDLSNPQISVSQEQSERLIAEVLPINGGVPAPFGSVTIRAGATIICTTPPVFNGVAFAAPPPGSYPPAATSSQPLSTAMRTTPPPSPRRLHLRAAGTHGNPVTVTEPPAPHRHPKREREP